MAGERNKLSPTILLAEDFDYVRDTLKLMLEVLGYRVLEAANGQEAVELARREHPALILMNMRMPVLDGVAATRLIRQEKSLSEVPIVAISGAGETYRQAALGAGCDEFLSKPIYLHQLEEVLRRLLP